MFSVNDKVVVSENIFPNSSDQHDIKMRGREGVVGFRMWEQFPGKGWDGCLMGMLESVLLQMHPIRY
jgi:hypothetical protein